MGAVRDATGSQRNVEQRERNEGKNESDVCQLIISTCTFLQGEASMTYYVPL